MINSGFMTLVFVLYPYVANSFSLTSLLLISPACSILDQETIVICSHMSLKTVPFSIFPPTSVNITLSYNVISRLTNDSFSTVPQIRYLDASHNSISMIEIGTFSGLKELRTFSVNHCQLKAIQPEQFQNNHLLKVLDLSYNLFVTQTPNISVLPTNSLEVLDLTKTNIRDLGRLGGTALRFKKLKQLFLGKNSIEIIRDQDLSFLLDTNLSLLDFSENKLSNIENGSFQAIRVKTLDLCSAIDSSSIRPELFIQRLFNALSKASFLENIILKNVGLEKIIPTTFKEAVNVSVLDFSENKLKNLTDNAFAGLYYLKNLTLSYNEIQYIEKNAFRGLSTLESLDLSHNRISYLQNGTFSSFSGTKTMVNLDLTANTITNLSPGIFNGLDSLRRLQLGKNRINQELNKTAFEGIPNIELIDMSLQEKITLKSDIFQHTPSLKVINLTTVGLSQLATNPSPFLVLKNLTYLSLQNNNMNYLDPNTFLTLESLENLDLQHNNLKLMWNNKEQLNNSNFLRRLFNLKLLDLTSNGFEKVPIDTFKDMFALETLLLNSNKINSIDGKIFKRIKSLKRLELQDNWISVINQSTLAYVSKSLKLLNVANNPFSCTCDLEWFRNFIDANLKKVWFTNLDNYMCDSPPKKRHTKLMSFHPSTECHYFIPFYVWIVLSIIFAVIIVAAVFIIRYRLDIRYMYLLMKAKLRGYQRISNQNGDCLYDAFVSYCRDDQVWVEDQLIPNIEENDQTKFKLCLHFRDFVPGKSILDNIVENIDKSRRTVCIVSGKSLESKWCSYERELAQHKMCAEKKVLIIIMLEDIPKERLTKIDKLHKLVSKNTYLDWPDKEGKGLFWEQLKLALR